jgi:hypothetical protein
MEKYKMSLYVGRTFPVVLIRPDWVGRSCFDSSVDEELSRWKKYNNDVEFFLTNENSHHVIDNVTEIVCGTKEKSIKRWLNGCGIEYSYNRLIEDRKYFEQVDVVLQNVFPGLQYLKYPRNIIVVHSTLLKS